MRIKQVVHQFLASAIALPLLTFSASAGPTGLVTVVPAPEDQGAMHIPGVRLVADLPAEYVEEEYFISGTASVYNFNSFPASDPTDHSEIDSGAYTTRIIVRRPADANKANGTVVIEWFNSTAGFDTAPSWDPSAEYFATVGISYVGVTNSNVSVANMLAGCPSFIGIPACGNRYAGLSIPENGMAYDIMNQLTNLLKSDDPDNPLGGDFTPDIVLHAGESQQAGSVITFASSFHTPGLSDGYFVQSNIGARAIKSGPRCGDPGDPDATPPRPPAPPYPDCTPRLLDSRVSTNLPVPVYNTVTQTDFEGLGFSVFGRQADTPTFRYYEITGAAHSTVHEGIEIIPANTFFFFIGPHQAVTLSDLCEEQLNTVADGPVFGSYVINALWERMQEQILDGDVPPAGVVMDTGDGFPPPLARDGNGNVTGGVRLPSMEAPTATYVSTATYDTTPTGNPFLDPLLNGIFQDGLGSLVCRLSGAVEPFDQATLDGLYPEHSDYVEQVVGAVVSLKAQGLLLQQNASTIKKAAAKSSIGN